MSSSEEYLDSLLDSILGGGKSDGEKDAASGAEGADNQTVPADGGKAMSSEEIEEMLVSMGTLGGTEEEPQEQESAEAEDMEAMLAFMNEHNAGSSDAGSGDADLALDDLGMEESMTSDDFALEETEAGEGMTDGLDDLSLDSLDLGESSSDDTGMGDLSLDDLSLDDLDMEESAASDGFALEEIEAGEGMTDGLDELSLDSLDLGESGDDAAADDLSLDDMDGLMSEEDIDRLLNGDLSDGEGGADDFALEETGESDEDLSALLAGMDHDEDLSEINDLLEGAEQGVSPDDDILAMLEGAEDGGDSSFDFFENDEAAKEAESIRELTPEEIAARDGGEKPKKEKKKRKRFFGKKKKGGDEEAVAEEPEDELEALLAETAEQEPAPEETKEKKPGVFARLMDFLLESDEDEDPVAAEVLADNAGETGTVTDENKALLEELKEEDKKGKKKKKKDKKKGKKGKEGEGEGEEGAEGEEDKKAKKKKKKEKKKKEEEEVDLFAKPEKKLSKKKVITVFVFCGTIAACIVLLASFLPDYTEKKKAQVAYDHQEYAEVYELLYGKKLNEQDEVLFQRSNLVLQMNRKLTSYENYGNLDMRLESLNALITGVARYQEILPEAEAYNVVGEVSDIYAQILERLSADFGVSEQDALDIIASEDDVTYSQRLEAIISGAVYGEDVPAGRQDVLPEEEEIIERIDGLEADIDETPEDMLPEELTGEETPAEETEGENGSEGEDMPTDENVDEEAE